MYRDQAHLDMAISLNNVGTAYDTLGDTQEGLKYKEQALEMFKELYGDQAHPDLARSLNNVGLAYHTLGDTRKGLGYQEQALEMYKKLYGDQAHPSLAMSLNNVGNAYHTLGETRKGLGYQEQALEMYKELYGEQAHPSLASSLNNVGNAYDTLGETQKGLVYYAQALEMRRVLYGDQAHPDLASSLNNVGSAYYALRKMKKALEYFTQALEMYKELYGEQAHPDLAMSLNNVGSAYATLGETRKGLGYKEQALEMYKKYCGDQAHPSLAMSLGNVGSAYENLEMYGEAKQYYEEGLQLSKKMDAAHRSYVQQFTQALGGLTNKFHVAASKAYAQQDIARTIHNYEQALALPMEEDRQRSICHDLGCMYHVAALGSSEEGLRQAYINKATTAFESALAVGDAPEAGLLTEYANFLLATAQVAKAHDYLVQAIESGDGESGLSYGLMERETVSPLLWESINQDGEVQVRGIDYALYLLIHHYEAFAQAGITLEKNRAAYLEDYAQGISNRAGQAGKEKQDEIAKFLLDSLRSAGA